jgi:hypothetical protein
VDNLQKKDRSNLRSHPFLTAFFLSPFPYISGIRLTKCRKSRIQTRQTKGEIFFLETDCSTFPEFASTNVGNRVSKRDKRGEKSFSWKLIAAFPRQEEETAKNSSMTTTTTKEENCWRTEVKTRADAASGSWWSRIGVNGKEQEQEQPSFAKNTNEEKKRKQ